MIEIRNAEGDWWYVECDCGYYAGPFDAKDDAHDDAHEHDCPPDRPEPVGTRDQATQLGIDLARVSRHSYQWLDDQIVYLQSCGLFSTFDELAKFARQHIDAGVSPGAVARMVIDVVARR